MSQPTKQAVSYLDQSEAVQARLARLKGRDVILRVNKLDKVFQSGKKQVTALHNISFQTHRREFLCIIGPSGCGKSTLIRILAGLETQSGGGGLLGGGAGGRPRR